MLVHPLDAWAWAFAWTCIIEIPIVMLMLRPTLGLPIAFSAALSAQVLTHPALWYLVPQFEPYALWLVCAETGVTAVEVLWFWVFLRWRHADRAFRWALGAALLANVVSTLAGVLGL